VITNNWNYEPQSPTDKCTFKCEFSRRSLILVLRGLEAEFDVFVESCKAKLRKPDPPIFNLALQTMNDYLNQHHPSYPTLMETDCIFVDDLSMNVKSARSLVCSN